MYSFPSNFDINILKSLTVSNIICLEHSVLIHFGEGDYLQIECNFVFDDGSINGPQFYEMENGVQALSLNKLISLKTVGAFINENDLTIKFEGDIELTLQAIENYESYRIKVGLQDIII